MIIHTTIVIINSNNNNANNNNNNNSSSSNNNTRLRQRAAAVDNLRRIHTAKDVLRGHLGLYMYMYMCVYMYVYIYIYIYVCIRGPPERRLSFSSVCVSFSSEGPGGKDVSIPGFRRRATQPSFRCLLKKLVLFNEEQRSPPLFCSRDGRGCSLRLPEKRVTSKGPPGCGSEAIASSDPRAGRGQHQGNC